MSWWGTQNAPNVLVKIQKLKAERDCLPDIQVFYWQLTLGCFQSTEHTKTDTRKFGCFRCIKHQILYPSDFDKKILTIVNCINRQKNDVHMYSFNQSNKSEKYPIQYKILDVHTNCRFQIYTVQSQHKYMCTDCKFYRWHIKLLEHYRI
jgi:hypothetical protein